MLLDGDFLKAVGVLQAERVFERPRQPIAFIHVRSIQAGYPVLNSSELHVCYIPVALEKIPALFRRRVTQRAFREQNVEEVQIGPDLLCRAQLSAKAWEPPIVFMKTSEADLATADPVCRRPVKKGEANDS